MTANLKSGIIFQSVFRAPLNSPQNGAGVEFFNVTHKASEANSGCIPFYCPVSQLHWHCLALSLKCTGTVKRRVLQKRTWVLLDIIYDGNISEMGHSGLKNVFGPLNQALRLFVLFIVFGAQLNCDQG